MSKPDVNPELLGKLTLQKYGQEKSISGVRWIDFNFHSDDGGDFHEIARLRNGLADGVTGFESRQINRSRFNPGLVKAFHLHLRQDEIWAVHPLDRLLVGLYDARRESETKGVSMRFVLGAGRCKLLFVPRGVAHGAMVLDQKPVDVIYLVNEHFSPDSPDEWRLPWNILGEDFWQIQKG